MGKLADLIADDKNAAGPPCTVAVLFTSLSKDVAADLREALADMSVTGASISRALDKLGHQVKAATLRRHRNGECGCGPSS